MKCLRSWAVNLLYDLAEVVWAVADQLSPATDEVWRSRRWKQHLGTEARLDSYTLPDAISDPANCACRYFNTESVCPAHGDGDATRT
jgi:hypothetical protein